MLRSAATAYLTERYRELSVYAEFTALQITSAYDGAIDMSLRYLEYVEADLATADVPQGSILKYLALLRYFALDRFATLLSIQFDAKVGKGSAEGVRSQAFQMVQQLKSQAAVELTAFGINVGGVAGFEMGQISLDIFEPSTLSEF